MMAKKKKVKKKIIKKNKGKGLALAYLSLGSNVGDREEFIEQALFLLEKNPNVDVIKRSVNYET